MKKLKIKYDFLHGPIWKDVYDMNTGKWSTGIKVVDDDKALSVLNEEAEKEYSSLYYFDENGRLNFDDNAYKQKKNHLLSLTQTIILRINSLKDGTFEIIDEASEEFKNI